MSLIFWNFLIILSSISAFQIYIDAFENGGPIPQKYTPFGIDVNPGISVSGDFPEKTLSLALVVADPDAPAGIWYHWLVKQIPEDTREIKENSCPGKEVKNSWGITQYKGPKPPNGIHRYFFQLYALDIETFDADNPEQFIAAIRKHTLSYAQYMGTFSSEKKN